VAIGAAVVLALVAVGGCGEEEAAKTTSMAIAVTEPSNHRFAYSAPRSVAAGLVELRLKNRGKEPHKAQLWRILDDHSVKAAMAARRPLPEWLITAGGVSVTAPGEASSAIQRLSPGRYFIAGSGGERGRVAPFTVTGKESDAKLPEADASIVYREYNFSSDGVRAGPNSIEFHNEGLEPHHAVVAPVKPGSSVRELRQFLRGKGKIPVGETADLENAVETAVLEEGQRQVVPMRLKRGKYALLCFVPDRKGGDPHVVKGMVDELTVR
jgi:hypothetical protein